MKNRMPPWAARKKSRNSPETQKNAFKFEVNEMLCTHALTGTKRLRCYWDQSALSQGEWDVPLLGKYQGISIESLINDPHKEGIILMHWDMFNEYAMNLKK